MMKFYSEEPSEDVVSYQSLIKDSPFRMIKIHVIDVNPLVAGIFSPMLPWEEDDDPRKEFLQKAVLKYQS